MKHNKYKCTACEANAKNARPVAVDNMENVILCNLCNLKLINRGEVRIDDETVLRTKGYRGDFLRVVAEQELTREKFWENRARVKELAMMDNQPTTGWDVHESY